MPTLFQPPLFDFNQMFSTIAGPVTIPARKTAEEALADFNAQYPSEERWRMLVDALTYANVTNVTSFYSDIYPHDATGWTLFENREPGCIAAFFRAWDFCLQEMAANPSHTDITINFIKKLHWLVTKDVHGGLDVNDDERGQFRNIICHFNLVNSCKYRYTEEGISDLILAISQNQLGNASISGYCYGEHNKSNINSDNLSSICMSTYQEIGNAGLTYHPPYRDIISERIYTSQNSHQPFFEIQVQKILDNYNKNIQVTNTDDGKLELIGKTIESLERTHPFADANGRTFVNLLLNYLLMKEGFPPATLIEPNVFDAFGHHVDVLKNGIANTLKIYHGDKNLFGFTVSNKDLIKKMNEIVANSQIPAKDTKQNVTSGSLSNSFNMFANGLSQTNTKMDVDDIAQYVFRH